MKSAEEWADECATTRLHPDWTQFKNFTEEVQADALRESIRIADTFALDHKLSAPEVIVAIQIREAIEKLVKEIEQ